MCPDRIDATPAQPPKCRFFRSAALAFVFGQLCMPILASKPVLPGTGGGPGTGGVGTLPAPNSGGGQQPPGAPGSP